MRRILSCGAAAVALALLITSCTTGGTEVDADLTKEHAKEVAQAGELEVASLVPEELVAAVDQHPTGTLFRCEGERDYSWVGGTTVTLSSPDFEAAITSILAIGDREGWRSERETAADGSPRAAVEGPDGYTYIVGSFPATTSILISSGSPCFHLAEGDSPLGGY